MKTTANKIAFIVMLGAGISVLALLFWGYQKSSEMVWNCTSHDQEQVDATFDSSRHAPIEITASAQGGECTLSCPNCENISFRKRNMMSKVHRDADCHFQAEVTSPGVISIKFNEMPEGDQDFNSYFVIDGENSGGLNGTLVKVTRRLQYDKTLAVSQNMASIDL